jgi:hypothetical protein
MDKGKMTVFAVMAAVLLTSAIFVVFLITTAEGNDSPKIYLPPAPSGGGSGTGGNMTDPDISSDEKTPIEITPGNVKTVIMNLERPESYSAEITVEYFWSGGSSSLVRMISILDGVARLRYFDREGLPTENYIHVDGYTYAWAEGSPDYSIYAETDITLDDISQIPTYEDILSADDGSIISAVYEYYNDEPCVRTDISDEGSGYVRKYWVSLLKGILWAAEYYEGDRMVYRMTVPPISFSEAAPDRSLFVLPNGRNLLDELG